MAFKRIKCKVCNNFFIPKVWNAKYCSKKCINKVDLDRYYKKIKKFGRERINKLWNLGYKKRMGYDPIKEIKCDICGKKFKRNSIDQKRCSNKCKKKYFNILKSEIYKNNVGYDPKDKIKCYICNKEFIRKSIKQKCCKNRECQLKHHRILNKNFYIRHNGYSPKDEINCCVCGQKFFRTNIQQKYCKNKECRRQYIYQRQIKIFKENNGYEPRQEIECYICHKKFIRRSIRYTCCNDKDCIREHRRIVKHQWNKIYFPINKKHIYKMRKHNLNYTLSNVLRVRIQKALKRYNIKKKHKTIELIGCTIKELMNHLEKKFSEGMTWDNHSYRGWHIDHCIPCAIFDLSKEEEQRKCFHYSNLQPMWGIDNMRKSKKYEIL